MDGERSATQHDAIAAVYAKDAAIHPINVWYERPALLRLMGDVGEHEVLEVGSAAGALSGELIDRGATVVACDVRDGLPLAFSDGRFDMIAASLVLHCIEDWEPVLLEFRRVLRPGGVVVFSTHHPALDWKHTSDDYFATRLITEQWNTGAEYNEFSFWRRPLREMTAAIKNAGFFIDELQEPEPLEELRTIAPTVHRSVTTAPRFLFFRIGLRG